MSCHGYQNLILSLSLDTTIEMIIMIIIKIKSDINKNNNNGQIMNKKTLKNLSSSFSQQWAFLFLESVVFTLGTCGRDSVVV